MSVSDMFTHIQGSLGADQDVREEIRKVVQVLEQTAREILTVLQSVHQPSGFKESFMNTGASSCSVWPSWRPSQSTWRLKHSSLVRKWLTFWTVVEVVRDKGFHLDVEDYLAGVLIMASELSRLAVNSVTAGDYTRPLRISSFINELDSGFRLLNLKNDPLRKRYDGLKYDVKKIEEVVYDLSIRGLAKETEGEK
ncbi:translin isoform X2 [Nerophis lumbriciformis]|uniref:translin isoform X2 n=1 Tax=Nerophis lumbriciformis TaxID=546530 RepID=UPI002AE0965B|nr:translin-like isoform X2 [Nerophis lumbriciformis]